MPRWIGDSPGTETTFRIGRFVPGYELANLPPTAVAVAGGLRKVDLGEGLRRVCISNMPGHEGNNTYCPSCGGPVITRLGFKLINNHLKHGRCPACGAAVSGVWR
jgi:pyruvate formate lyase activating enzyme